MPPLRAMPAGAPIRWTIDGIAADSWQPTPGPHVVKAAYQGAERSVSVEFD